MLANMFELSMTSIQVTALVVISMIIAAVCLWGRSDVSRFLSQYPAIESETSLAAFKSLVRRQMRVAIGVMALGLVFGALCMFLTMQLMLTGLMLVLALGIPIFLVGRNSKRLETKARTLVCSNENLQVEYARVAAAWTKQLFPDF